MAAVSSSAFNILDILVWYRIFFETRIKNFEKYVKNKMKNEQPYDG